MTLLEETLGQVLQAPLLMATESRPQRWADVADSSEEGEEGNYVVSVPTGEVVRTASPGPATWNGSSERSLSSSAGSAQPARPPTGAIGLRATAPEFIPTLTMHCPLVGLYHVQDKACGSTEVAEVPAMRQVDEPQARRRRRNKAAKSLSGQLAQQQWGVMPEASEEVWEQRVLHRRKVLETLQARLLRLSKQHVEGSSLDLQLPPSAQGVCRSEVQKEWRPRVPGPDPENRSVSRRQWRKAVDEWFKASLLQAEYPGSVVSTEECISTNCDGDSECSD